MIITNFKLYKTGTGAKALELAKIHDEVTKETGANIQVVVQALDLAKISQAVDIPVLSQHIDPVNFGSGTGHILPEAVKNAGGEGTILNHSEKRLDREVLRESVKRAKESGLSVIICAESPEEGASFLEFDPDYIAVEPPELIGGDISVSTSKPEIIENAAKLIGTDKLLIGAGIKNGEDVKIAIQLGAKGVLLASGVTKAEDPKAVLMDLASGL